MSFSVLIATYNRSNQLKKLFDSIIQSTLIPDEIIVVWAGRNVEDDFQLFNKSLNLKFIQSKYANQIYQKQIGIKQISLKSNYVVFLDDDVRVDQKCFQTVSEEFDQLNDDYRGIALNLQIPQHRYTKLELFLAKLFFLGNNLPGKVRKNGQANAYLHSETNIDIEWANGISAWRTESLSNYGFSDLSIGYSAYEDVIFSYKVSRSHKIKFLRQAKVYSDDNPVKRLSNSQFYYASLWRLFFVKTNKNFSKFLFFYSHLARSIEFVLKSTEQTRILNKIIYAIYVLSKLLRASMDIDYCKKQLFLVS